MMCNLNNHTYKIHKTYTYVQLYSLTMQGDNLPSNDGLSSGESCQHWTIHFLANDSKSSGPVISLRGGRLPAITAVFTCSSLVADKGNIQQIRYSARGGWKWRLHQATVSINKHLTVIAACCRFGCRTVIEKSWQNWFMWPCNLELWPPDPQYQLFHALAPWTIPLQKGTGLKSAPRLLNGSIGHPQNRRTPSSMLGTTLWESMWFLNEAQRHPKSKNKIFGRSPVILSQTDYKVGFGFLPLFTVHLTA